MSILERMDELDGDRAGILDAARSAVANAYCPYSGVRVGAAVLTKSGRIHAGTNVESGSFGLTICAERSALVRAVGSGEKEFSVLAVSSPDLDTPVPCGACLQVMAEFSGDLEIILEGKSGKIYRTTLDKLLPLSFRFPKNRG